MTTYTLSVRFFGRGFVRPEVIKLGLEGDKKRVEKILAMLFRPHNKMVRGFEILEEEVQE